MRFETLLLSWHVVARNWIVYKKDFIANISPTVADPLLFLFSLGFGLGGHLGQIDGLTYSQFLAPGLIASTALFTAFFDCSYGFYVTMTFENIYKAMLTTPIGPRETLTGQMMWIFLKGALMAFGVSLVILAFGLVKAEHIPAFALLGGLMAIPCGAIGLISAAVVRNINQFQSIYSFLIAPIYFFSGVFFPVSSLPPSFSWVLHISPFFHGVRMTQMVAWERIDWNLFAYHLSATLVFSVVLCAFAFRKIEGKLVS